MATAADVATDPAVQAQYLELAGKWTRLAEEISRRWAGSGAGLVGDDDLPSLEDDHAAARSSEVIATGWG